MSLPKSLLSYAPHAEFPNLDDILAAWAKLGMTYAIDVPSKPVDPERTILLSMRFLALDSSLIPMIKGWLNLMGDLIHIDRLLALMDRLNWLTGQEKVEVRFLGGLAAHTQKTHKQWQKVADACQNLLHDSKPIDLIDSENYQAKAYGTDQNFAEFGLTIANRSKRFSSSDSYEHKLLTREAILAQNSWLRLRLILPFWRADLLFAQLKAEAKNARQLSILVGCSHRTAYLWCKDSEEAHAIEIFSHLSA